MTMSKLFQKTLFIMVVLFGVIAVATSGLAGWNLYTHLTQEFTSKGTAIAKSVADASVEILLDRDISTVQAILDQFVEIDGVGYVFVADENREIISHTFVPKVPEEILTLQVPEGIREKPIITDLHIEGRGDFIDISAPILAGVAGSVHVGMDKKIIQDNIVSAVILQQGVMFVIFLLSIAVAYLLVRRISQPLNELTVYSQQLASHDFSAPLPMRASIERLTYRSRDEMGELAHSFTSMERALEQTIRSLKETGDQLSASHAKLEEYSQTLEQKVEERTQELQVKNDELGTTLQRLKQTQDQLIMQEKLASLGGLTAGIAHEIKNPLNFVNNFSEISVDLISELRESLQQQKDRLDGETIEEMGDVLNDLQVNVRKINEHGKRADSIVRGMLLHSRGTSGERHPTNINDLLDEYVNLAYHGMRAKDSAFNIAIEKRYDLSIGQLNVVPQNLSRVFLNILNNACYAAHEKKKKTDADFAPTLAVGTKNLGDKVEIRIRDNGNGMPASVREKIFNPFFTTKPTGVGTGLGLSISYDIIVQEHKGEIRVESEEGEYAEFIITLPRNGG